MGRRTSSEDGDDGSLRQKVVVFGGSSKGRTQAFGP